MILRGRRRLPSHAETKHGGTRSDPSIIGDDRRTLGRSNVMRIAHVAFVLVGCAGTVQVPASSERPGASAENAVEVERPAVSIASESTYPEDHDFETRDDAATESARTLAVDAAPPEVPPTEEEIRQAMQGSIYWLVGEGAQSRCHEYRWTPARQPPHSAELERPIPRGTESFAVLVRHPTSVVVAPTQPKRAGCGVSLRRRNSNERRRELECALGLRSSVMPRLGCGAARRTR